MFIMELHEQFIPGKIDKDRLFKELAEMAGTDRYFEYGIEIPASIADIIDGSYKVNYSDGTTEIRYLKVMYDV